MEVIKVDKDKTVFLPYAQAPACRRCDNCGYHVVSGECSGTQSDGRATINTDFKAGRYTSLCGVEGLARN